MREETLLILGGYGGAGKVLADLLLQETELRLLIGGRDPAKAEALAFELNTRHSCHRVEARPWTQTVQKPCSRFSKNRDWL